MNIKVKEILLSATVILLGVLLCVFGLGFHSEKVAPEKGDTPALVRSEPELIKEASIGGLTLDAKSGKIKQTYTGVPPEECPT